MYWLLLCFNYCRVQYWFHQAPVEICEMKFLWLSWLCLRFWNWCITTGVSWRSCPYSKVFFHWYSCVLIKIYQIYQSVKNGWTFQQKLSKITVVCNQYQQLPVMPLYWLLLMICIISCGMLMLPCLLSAKFWSWHYIWCSIDLDYGSVMMLALCIFSYWLLCCFFGDYVDDC